MRTKFLLLIFFTLTLFGCGGGGGSSAGGGGGNPVDENVSAAIAAPTPAAGTGIANAVTLSGTLNFSIGPVSYEWRATGANASSAHFGTPTGTSSTPGATTTFYTDAPGTFTVELAIASLSDATKTAVSPAVTVTVTDATVLGQSGSYFPLGQFVAPNVERNWTYVAKVGTSSKVVNATAAGTLHTVNHSGSNPDVTTEVINIYTFPTTGAFVGGMIWTSQQSVGVLTAIFTPGQPIFPPLLTPGLAQSLPYVTTFSDGSATINHTAVLTVIDDGLTTRTVNGVGFNDVIHIQTVIDGGTPANSYYARGVGLIEDDSYLLTTYSHL